MKNKVVFIGSLEVIGGVETVLKIILPKLLSQYDVSFISMDKIPENFKTFFKSKKIKFQEFLPLEKPKSIFPYLIYFFKKRLVKIKRKAYLKSFNLIIDFKNGAGRNLIKKIKVPKILWIHGGFPFVKQWMKFDFSMFDRIVVLTDSLKEKLQQQNPHIANRIVRIYNPIELKDIVKKSQQGDDFSYPYFCHVSRLSADKDIKTIIDAYDHFIQQSNSKTKLLLVGDGPLMQEYMQYAHKKKSADQIIFTGQKDNPYTYMKGAKAVILSSKSEGLPCVLIEGLACTKGVVVSSNCPEGPNEILLGGKAGILFPVADVKKLEKILLDIDNGIITKAKFKKYIPKALKRFDPEEILPQIIDLINTTKGY